VKGIRAYRCWERGALWGSGEWGLVSQEAQSHSKSEHEERLVEEGPPQKKGGPGERWKDDPGGKIKRKAEFFLIV